MVFETLSRPDVISEVESVLEDASAKLARFVGWLKKKFRGH